MRAWDKKDWIKSLTVNGFEPYNLAINFEALCIAKWGERKKPYVSDLSGAQYDLALKLSNKLKNI